MVTHDQFRIFMPNRRYANLAADMISSVPHLARAALRDPHWTAAMQVELDALHANQTWTLVPRPRGANLITIKWVFCQKFHPDGSLDRYKARWIVRGFAQPASADIFETFSPVVKSASTRFLHTRGPTARCLPPVARTSTTMLFCTATWSVFCVNSRPVGFADAAHPDDV